MCCHHNRCITNGRERRRVRAKTTAGRAALAQPGGKSSVGSRRPARISCNCAFKLLRIRDPQIYHSRVLPTLSQPLQAHFFANNNLYTIFLAQGKSKKHKITPSTSAHLDSAEHCWNYTSVQTPLSQHRHPYSSPPACSGRFAKVRVWRIHP